MGAWSGKESASRLSKTLQFQTGEVSGGSPMGQAGVVAARMIENADAVSNANALPDDADSHSHSEPELIKNTYFSGKSFSNVVLIPAYTFSIHPCWYWKAKNHASRRCHGRT